MDIVGSAFLSSLFQVLFDKMASPGFLSFFRKRKYHKDHLVEKLNSNLRFLRAVLEDAENKRKMSKAVNEWLDELQHAIYHVEDLLDEINTEALRVKVESEYQSPTNQVSAPTQTSNLSNEFLKEIMPRIQEMVDLSEKFVEQTHVLGLIKKEESREQPFRLPSTSLVDETDVYGRDADKDKIIQELLSDGATGKTFTVISIIGLGGIGKTTLAQLVYNDERMKEHFDTKAWVCVSEKYDAMRITKALLKELNISSSDPDESFNSLQVKLKEGLSKKKFLLVLDDVWNRDYNDWWALSTPFNGGKEGSKIIVTTRDKKVASTMGNPRQIHRLDLMTEDDCWFLFEKQAFNNRDPATDLEFESIGRDIVKKCKGLPLAVKTIAGVLRSKETVEDWKEVLRSDQWDNPSNATGILPSLRLSYSCLPSQLKSCFAYCAVFHKDYHFEKDEVILLWMANDLLENSKSNRRPEDIGEEFLRELRFRSLFQQSSNGKFSMHDRVNDLAKFVSGKYFLRLEDHWQQDNSLIEVRHFSYLGTRKDEFQKFKPLYDMKFLRTFLPIHLGRGYFGIMLISKKLLNDILPTFKSLRVLSLASYVITELPNNFKNLKQLRFLNFSHTSIEKLPDWICTLYNLQILLLVGCKKLKEFPKDMEKLINLRHIDISGVDLKELPIQIERLASLDFLAVSTFTISIDGGSRIKDLGRLPNLHGELTILGLENVVNDRDASMAKMKDKKHIEKLFLTWSGNTNDLQVAHDVLENLQPYLNIKCIRIDGYCGTKFSNWFGDPVFCHMTSIYLLNCVHCRHLPALGQLPCLEFFTVHGLTSVEGMGQEIYGDTDKPFPCLKVLRVQDMCKWREWYVPENGVFSCLEELYIVKCPQLIGELPKQLSSLRRLRISGCPGFVNSDGQMTIFDIDANWLQRLCSLLELEISNMPNLKELSSSHLKRLLPRLEKFEIERCSDIVSFPIHCLPNELKHLLITECGNLKLETREMAGSCHVSMESLSIFGGTDSLTNLWHMFPNLQDLHIYSLSNFEGLLISQGNQNLPASNLNQLYLFDCWNLKSLPERMHILLPSLRHLFLSHCPEIECFPEGGLPSGLKWLEIAHCEKLVRQRREWGLERLLSLLDFSFKGSHEEPLLEDLPLPCTLERLTLGFHDNVKGLSYAALQPLPTLKYLTLRYCKKLQRLPEEGLPFCISELVICGCPLLKQRLEPEKGKDWSKVAHIPCIEVDGQLIP